MTDIAMFQILVDAAEKAGFGVTLTPGCEGVAITRHRTATHRSGDERLTITAAEATAVFTAVRADSRARVLGPLFRLLELAGALPPVGGE